MTMALKRSKYWREYVGDEFAAASMNVQTIDAMIAVEAIALHISNSEWLTLRLCARAGVYLHEREGKALHGSGPAVRRSRLFEFQLGKCGRWDW